MINLTPVTSFRKVKRLKQLDHIMKRENYDNFKGAS